MWFEHVESSPQIVSIVRFAKPEETFPSEGGWVGVQAEGIGVGFG